jgi:hypothetical protein
LNNSSTHQVNGQKNYSTSFVDIFNGGPNNIQPSIAKRPNLSGQRWILTKTGTHGATKVD